MRACARSRSQSSSRDEVVGHSVGGTCKSKHTHKALSVLICRMRSVSCRGLVSVSVLTVMCGRWSWRIVARFGIYRKML